MLTLPPALAALSKLTAKPTDRNSARYPTAEGVCVTATPDGWQAAATDFNRLLLVTGPHPDPKPEYQVLADAPNGATAGSVPAKWWGEVFGGAKKVRGTPGVGLVLSPFAASASDGFTSASRTSVLTGKLPPFADIVPKRESDIGCVIRFDPQLMAGLLKALAEVSDPGADPVVTLEVRRPNGPKSADKALVLRADYPAAGVTAATGLLMPCGGEGDAQSTNFFAPQRGEDEAAATDPQAGADAAELRAEVSDWKALATANDAEASRLRAEVNGLRDGVSQQANVIRILEGQIEGQAREIEFQRGEADSAHRLLARFRDETEHGNELIGLWGRLGDAERTTRDAVTGSDRLRAELEAVRNERDRLLADIHMLRARPAVTAPVPHHRPAGLLPARRTLGELAAAQGGA